MSTTWLRKLTVVFEYCKAKETYSRISEPDSVKAEEPLFFQDTQPVNNFERVKTTLETSEEDLDTSVRYYGYINEENYEKMMTERNKKKNQFDFNEKNQGVLARRV